LSISHCETNFPENVAIMPEPLTQALQGWQNFYLLAGTASATLTGLLFVAVSLGTHMVAGREDSVRTFVTPTLVHFIAVVVIAAVMLIPTHSLWSLSGSLLVIGVTSVTYSVQIILQMLRGLGQDSVDRAHWVWHAALPLISYATVAGAAIWLVGSSN
jgi:hypothetical protein